MRHLCSLLCSVSLVTMMLAAVNARAAESSNQLAPEFSESEIARILAFGPWPLAHPADPGNEFSGLVWAETAGEVLFNDKGLSAGHRASCADCHQQGKGFTDARAVAIAHGTHVRNTQGLLDVALQRWFGWDGGTDSLWSAAIRPMLSPIEMNNTITKIAQYLRSNNWLMTLLQSKRAVDSADLSQSGSTPDQVLVVAAAKLIAAYTRTLSSPETPFDRFRQALSNRDSAGLDRYSVQAQRGLKLFLGDANCSVCHFGPAFSNGEFHDTGRPFFTGVGQVDPGRYTGIQRVRDDPYNLLGVYNATPDPEQSRKTATVKLTQSNWGQWRTPTLRNLTLTAPYMHDGSIATLRGVVDAYADIDPDRLHSDAEAILKPLNLSDSERDDLVVFLQSLTSVDP